MNIVTAVTSEQRFYLRVVIASEGVAVGAFAVGVLDLKEGVQKRTELEVVGIGNCGHQLHE